METEEIGNRRRNLVLEFTTGKQETCPRIFTYEMRQDDPAKCTSAKMRKFRIARGIRKEQIPQNAIVLNPAAESIVLNEDRENAGRFGLVVIDCSWNLAEKVFKVHFKGIQRKLPALLAGNPTNYAKLGRLSSLEAVGAALYIMNYKKASEEILSLYKWGPTFLTLNHDPLEEYAKANNNDEVIEIEKAYFGFKKLNDGNGRFTK
jgi:pre-rRNA-processing protein TSR3